MCTCASCEYTDGFAGKGVDAWPRGEPAGQGMSERAYAAHAKHVWAGAYKTVAFKLGQAPRYPAWTVSKALGDGGEHRTYPSAWGDDREKTTAEYVAEFIKENGYLTDEKLAAAQRYRETVKREERAALKREKASPTYAEPARPATPGKAPQHFPAPDRQRETAVIYDMAKEKAKKQRGRPAIGKPFLVRLEAEHIQRAEKLGGGNISAGIRKALERRQSSG